MESKELTTSALMCVCPEGGVCHQVSWPAHPELVQEMEALLCRPVQKSSSPLSSFVEMKYWLSLFFAGRRAGEFFFVFLCCCSINTCIFVQQTITKNILPMIEKTSSSSAAVSKVARIMPLLVQLDSAVECGECKCCMHRNCLQSWNVIRQQQNTHHVIVFVVPNLPIWGGRAVDAGGGAEEEEERPENQPWI